MLRLESLTQVLSRRRLALFSLLLVSVEVGAQHPVLAPTSNTTIVVTSAPLRYSSITVPAGVTVRFVAPGFGPNSMACQQSFIVMAMWMSMAPSRFPQTAPMCLPPAGLPPEQGLQACSAARVSEPLTFRREEVGTLSPMVQRSPSASKAVVLVVRWSSTTFRAHFM